MEKESWTSRVKVCTKETSGRARSTAQAYFSSKINLGTKANMNTM